MGKNLPHEKFQRLTSTLTFKIRTNRESKCPPKVSIRRKEIISWWTWNFEYSAKRLIKGTKF